VNTVLTLHDPGTARRYYIDGLWRRDTLYSLLRDHAAERPSAFAARDGWRRVTWGELLRWVDGVAADLHEAGVRAGERVSVWLPSRIEALVVFLACSRNGYLCKASMHQRDTAGDVLGLLRAIGAAALFAETAPGADSQGDDVFVAARSLPTMKRVYRLPRLGSQAAEGATGAPFPTPVEGPRPRVPMSENPDKVVYLAFTSGTSGAPKGVMHSDNTLLANGRALVADWKHDDRTVLLALSPLSHHIGTVAITPALVAGCELVTSASPPGMKPLDWILQTGATYVMGVPTHAIDLLAEMKRRGMSRLSNVAVLYMAGSPIPREVAQALLDRGITPQNVYGMTENGSHHYPLPTDDPETMTATCGRACRSYEVRLWDRENPDVEAAPGEIGEIGGRGASLMLGYFADQAATEQSFNRHGWFLSGDLGRLDERGCLQIVGRKKDVIIRGGHNIHPARIEELALRDPCISQAAAFPVSDERLGEKVCLAVIAADDTAPDPQQTLARLQAAGLSKYDLPEYFVALHDFPRTASGKVLKRQLVEWARDGRIRPQPVRRTAEASGPKEDSAW
jgi:acyl-CoA synthetase